MLGPDSHTASSSGWGYFLMRPDLGSDVDARRHVLRNTSIDQYLYACHWIENKLGDSWSFVYISL